MSGRRINLRLLPIFRRLFNPALCQLCGTQVSSRDYLCQHCDASMPRVPNPCPLCGLPNHDTALNGDSPCAACLKQPPPWDQMIAPLEFTGYTRDLLLKFKFCGQMHQALILLAHCCQAYRQRPVEVLLPVPLHPQKSRQRGFNQAQEITAILSGLLQRPIDQSCLNRVKPTKAQSGLSLSKRLRNLQGAFEFTTGTEYKRVAIVDDIITSGSTMQALCKVLRKGGVEYIEVWSIARTLKQRD